MKRITMKDIAAELEVSVQSVSQALNRTGRLGSETRRRILNAAERLNYRPNILARGLWGVSKIHRAGSTTISSSATPSSIIPGVRIWILCVRLKSMCWNG